MEFYNTAVNAKIMMHHAYAEEFYAKIKSSSSILCKIKNNLRLHHYPYLLVIAKESQNEEMDCSKNESSLKKKELTNKVKNIHTQHMSNRILLFNKEKMESLNLQSRSSFTHKCLKEYYLVVSGGIPVLPFKHSQYIVDYHNNTLYYFNVLHEGKIKHFEFIITPTKTELEGKFNNLSNHPWTESLTNMGLCIGSNKIFVVYGRYIENGVAKNSDKIYYYDMVRKKWYNPKIKGLDEQAKKRHSVTCCLLQDIKTGGDFLYVFGGECESSPDNKLNICNIVECYKITYSAELEDSEFEHIIINKVDLYSEKVSYIPYVYSYAFQIANTNNILIFGGEKYSLSSYDAKATKYFFYK